MRSLVVVLGRGDLIWMLASLVGVKAAGLMQSAAKRLGGLSVSDVLKSPDERFVLYLRPFDTDDVILPKPRLPFLSRFLTLRPFPVRVEEELFDVADGDRPLIAVARPGPTPSGRGRAGVSNSARGFRVAKLCHRYNPPLREHRHRAARHRWRSLGAMGYPQRGRGFEGTVPVRPRRTLSGGLEIGG